MTTDLDISWQPRGISYACLQDLLFAEIQLTFNRFRAYRSELMRAICDMRLICGEVLDARRKALAAHAKASSLDEQRLLADLLRPLNELSDDDTADVPLRQIIALIIDEVREMSRQELSDTSTEGGADDSR